MDDRMTKPIPFVLGRIGDASFRVSPGAELRTCSRCGDQCWINQPTQALADQPGVRPIYICQGCWTGHDMDQIDVVVQP